MIKSLLLVGCVCLLLLRVPQLAGQDPLGLLDAGPVDPRQVRDDPAGSVFSPFSEGDSFEKLALHTLFKATLVRELGLSLDQQEKYIALNEKLPQWQAEEEKRLESIHGKDFLMEKENRAKYVSELNQAIQKRWYKEIKDSILLPFQAKGLEQNCVAQIRNQFGDDGLLSTRWMRDELEIDDAQAERLDARVKKEKEKLEVEIKKLEEQIAELRARAKENILSELTHEQREKLNEVIPVDSDADQKKETGAVQRNGWPAIDRK